MAVRAQILYLDNYAPEEAERLRELGSDVAIEDDVRRAVTVLRGPKLKPAAYAARITSLEQAGVRPTTPAQSYDALSDSSRYEDLIPDHVPPKAVLALRPEAEAIAGLTKLASWGEVFIRSEQGSAAKSAGLDACILSTFSSEAIAPKVLTLSTAFPSADRVIARQVIPIRSEGTRTAEGRFVVLIGRVAYLDHCELEGSEAAAAFAERNRPNAEAIASALTRGGISGDYFLDIAEKAAGGWFVVEIKPLFNGTIRNLQGFSSALAAM